MSTPNTERRPQADLDYLIGEIIHCDDEFCPDLRDMYMDGVFLMMENKFPEIHRDLLRCSSDNRPDHECTPIYMEGLERVGPLFQQYLDSTRQAQSPDPLQNYDGIKYGSPFWFEGTGDVWRRTSHGSKRVSVKECNRIRQDSEDCLSDPSKPNDYCFRLYGHALSCEAGTNCQYLRFPLMKCLQETHVVDYQRLKSCVEAIPNYQACTRGYVPQPNNANL